MTPRDRAVLPAKAAERIEASLETARLSRRDREEVADELAAHVEDGLASGRNIEAILADFDDGDPARTGVLIGRSIRRRRRAETAPVRAMGLLVAAVAVVYAGIFARLHTASPERTWPSPSAAVAAWRAPHESERAAFETVLASMYSKGEDGRLTAAGLRAYQAWKGKAKPSFWSIALEPAYFPSPAPRGDVRREFERFLRLAQDRSDRAFEVERDALLADRGRALRFVALQIPLERLSQARRNR